MNYLMLDLFLCFDLISIIRNPFGSKERRVSLYVVISLLVGLVNAIIFMKTNALGSIFLVSVMGCYLIVSTWSVLFCAYRLYYSGLSKQARSLVLKRHVFWIFSFILTNSYLMYLNVLVIYVQFTNTDLAVFTRSAQHDDKIGIKYSYFYDGQGILILLHMFVEPGFYRIIYNNLRGRTEINTELPSMFMFASQLNAEMVYSILKGITKFSHVSFTNFESKLRSTSVN